MKNTNDIKITGVKDKKAKEFMEALINYEYPKHKNFIESVILAKHFILRNYGIEIPQEIWDRILDAYMKKVIELEK